MPSPYNDVEITEDDKQSLFENPGIKEDQNPTEAPVEVKDDIESQAHEAEPQESIEDEGVSEVSESDEFNLEDYEVEIDGETFDGADIMRWQEDSANKDN